MVRLSNSAKAAQARRARLLTDVPRALEAEERRAFDEAKRLEASGQRSRAEQLFDASRRAFHAREEIRKALETRRNLDEALERAYNLLLRLTSTA